MVIIVFISMLIYGIIHSIAAGRFKTVFRMQFGERAYEGLYRLLYNIFAVISLAPVSYLFTFHPGNIVWEINLQYEPILLIIQAIGLIGSAISLFQIDLGYFLGVTQFINYIRNKGENQAEEEQMQRGGLYAFVRHPLYLFSILAIWPVTTMTEAYLGFCLGVTAYFVIGSLYEERRLAEKFGEQYRLYQQNVPWLIPFLRINLNKD